MALRNDFIGRYANLEGYSVGEHLIEDLAGRNAAGALRWKVVCRRCGNLQIMDHERLAPLVEGRNTQKSLFCSNPACALSRQSNASETLTDFRRAERLEAEQAAKAAEEKQRSVQAQAAQQHAASQREEALRAGFRKYWHHEMKLAVRLGIADLEPITLNQWKELGQNVREEILKRVEEQPQVPLRLEFKTYVSERTYRPGRY